MPVIRSIVFLLATLSLPPASLAGVDDPYPAFTAHYSVRIGGMESGRTMLSLSRVGEHEYLYRQTSKATGVAALFSSDSAEQSSRWRYSGGGIRPLEFRSRRAKGDDDDNAHLFFDWRSLRVENRGAGDHWRIAMPEGTLDSLSMQLAMVLGLREGRDSLSLPVAVRGRIKTYRFEKTGEEPVELAGGSYHAIRMARTDDKEDKSWFWFAPALDYMLVRFVKKKKNGLTTEMLLQDVRFEAR